MYVFPARRDICGSALFDAFVLLTASKAIILQSRYNGKDRKFLSENTSKQYEYRRHKHGCHKSHLAIYFFKLTHVARALFLCIFFRATLEHIAKQRVGDPSREYYLSARTRTHRHRVSNGHRGQKGFHLPRAKRWLKAYSCRGWLYAASPMVFLAYIFMARQYEYGIPAEYLSFPLSTFAFVCRRVYSHCAPFIYALPRQYLTKAIYQVAIKSVYDRTILNLKEAARQSTIQSSCQSFSPKDDRAHEKGCIYMRESILANLLTIHAHIH